MSECLESPFKLRTTCMFIKNYSYERFSSMLQEMTPFECEEIYKYKYFPEQFATLLSYYEVKKCVENYFSPPSMLYMQKDNFGRPSLKGWSGDISISHTDGCVLIGVVNQGKIGVDVQKIEYVNKGAEHYFLSEKEKAQFNSLPHDEKTKYLFTIWTLKEALLKWLGSGFLEKSPTDISFFLDHSFKEVIDIEGMDMVKVKFKLFSPFDHFQAAVCYNDLSSKVEIPQFEHDYRSIF